MSRHRLVSCALGLLLLAAAALKAQGLAADPVGRMGIFSTPEFQLAVVEFELFLAVWLLWGKRPLASWTVALATFATFAAITFYQGWIGQSSCGCFGRLLISPWHAFALDLLIVAALVFGRPDLQSLWENPRLILTSAALPAACGLIGLVVIGGAMVAMANLAFGSVPAAIAYCRGERVSVTPSLVDVGEGTKGESRNVSVTLTNWTDQPIQLFGGTADCSCTVLHDLPVTIPPEESRIVSIQIHLTGKPGIFTRTAAFLVNDGSFTKIKFRLTGRITASVSAMP